MKDRSFICYRTQVSYLGGEVKDGRLRIYSEVYGDGDKYPYDSERTYDFTAEMTERLFSLISLDDFVKLCREKYTLGMEEFLRANSIEFKTFTWWEES